MGGDIWGVVMGSPLCFSLSSGYEGEELNLDYSRGDVLVEESLKQVILISDISDHIYLLLDLDIIADRLNPR